MKKKILLIGSTGILGRYYARELKKKYELIQADLNLKNDKKKKSYSLDISNESNVEFVFNDIKKKYGYLDFLINNSALTTEMAAKLKKTKDLNLKNKKDYFNSEIWNKTLNVNTTGFFYSCKHFILKHHMKNKLQKVINVSSIYGLSSPHHEIYDNESFFSSISYTASKSGVVGLTKWLSTKYVKEKTLFNTLVPAGVYNNHKKRFLKKYEKLVPINRMAIEKEIFSGVEFLLNENNTYFTGQCLEIDGGFRAW